MNNPFDYTPDPLCEEAFQNLIRRIEAIKISASAEDAELIRELEAGKMLGVLVARDSSGVRHTLYAFSGQIGRLGFHYPGFVGPVFDYLDPDGYFKIREAAISRQNVEIAEFESRVYASAKKDYDIAREEADLLISEYKDKYRLSKMKRAARRNAGGLAPDEEAEMIRRSQFEKAEINRLKKRMAERIKPLEEVWQEARRRLENMKENRKKDSEALQDWLFSKFILLNARGESRSLSEIFIDTPMGIPPSGAGECCAPKLLHAAYQRGWYPESIAEYWYGKPKEGEVRIHGAHYPACRGKCLPVLGWMLRGLDIDGDLNCYGSAEEEFNPEIIYENRWICVVNKPAGMLSVPGKGSALSLQDWLAKKYGSERFVRMAHRLDQDTSGLIIAALDPEAFKILQSLFTARKVNKTYIAELEGDFESLCIPRRGHIELALSPDRLDRPRQRIDPEKGKEAVTDYEFTGASEGRSRIKFHPLTGRTHQLRVHSASESGLGMPIAGDRLYGTKRSSSCGRLHLHSQKIEFLFPLDGQHYCFEIPVPF